MEDSIIAIIVMLFIAFAVIKFIVDTIRHLFGYNKEEINYTDHDDDDDDDD